jgi:hypothetical protein
MKQLQKFNWIITIGLLPILVWGLLSWRSQSASIVSPAVAASIEIPTSGVIYAEALPLPADAQEVSYNADFKRINFSSPSEIKSLAEFYRQRLSARGWREERLLSVLEKSGAVLRFKQGEASATINISKGSADQGFEVTINTNCVMWANSVANRVLTAEALPIPANVQEVSYNADFKQISFSSPWNTGALVGFYRRGLAVQGWQEARLFSVVQKSGAVLRFKQGEASLSVNISKNSSDQETEVTMNTNCVMWADPKN